MRSVALLVLFASAGGGRAQGPTAEDLAGFERTLRDHHLPAQGPELLKFFRDRTLSGEQVAQLSAKVEELSSEVYSVRVKAAAALVKAGHFAKSFLVALIKNPQADPEAIRRAELCLRQITEGNETSLAVATAHLIARDRPAQAAEVLVRYTPFATDPATIEAVQLALNSLATVADEPEPALTAALKAKAPAMRAAAGEALVRGGGLKHKALVGHLLADPVPQVRLQLALALAGARDKAAVPVLIELLAQLPVERVWPAEDLLLRVAGENAPALSLGGKAPAAKVRAAWLAWWQSHEAEADLGRLAHDAQLQGYTLVTVMVPGPGLNGRIMELGPDKQVQWKIDGIRYPLDAQVVGRDRVLIAEYFGNRVTERDFKGNVLWEKACPNPLSCQRFPSGDTFIVTRRSLFLVDRDGKELFTYFLPNANIVAAQRARNGQMTLVTSAGRLQVLDPQGKEVRGFPVGMINMLGSTFELLPGGRVLVPLYRDNRVVEYDTSGRVVWQANVPGPITATRLPNRNTLVASATGQRLVEINRDGSEVWSYMLEGRPWRVRRR
jgi:hypothetical protein